MINPETRERACRKLYFDIISDLPLAQATAHLATETDEVAKVTREAKRALKIGRTFPLAARALYIAKLQAFWVNDDALPAIKAEVIALHHGAAL